LPHQKWYALAAVLFASQGCAAIPPAAEIAATSSSFSFSAGRGTQAFAAPPSAVLAALIQALGDLNFHSVNATRDGAVARLDAQTADARRAVATIRTQRGLTLVSIRVSWFGDEPLSRALLQRVAIRLGSLPPDAIPASAPSAPEGNPFFARDAIPDSEMLRDLAEAPYRDRVIP
jgi:hypothetical protein